MNILYSTYCPYIFALNIITDSMLMVKLTLKAVQVCARSHQTRKKMIQEEGMTRTQLWNSLRKQRKKKRMVPAVMFVVRQTLRFYQIPVYSICYDITPSWFYACQL